MRVRLEGGGPKGAAEYFMRAEFKALPPPGKGDDPMGEEKRYDRIKVLSAADAAKFFASSSML